MNDISTNRPPQPVAAKLDPNQIICGNCLDVMDQIPSGSIPLGFSDPPFNIGYAYDQHQDNMSPEQYRTFSREWLGDVYRVLAPDGSFYLAIGDNYAEPLSLIAQELGFHRRRTIIWHYTFGQQPTNNYAQSHATIYYFVKNPKRFTFNADAIRVPSARQLVYNDKRAKAKGKLPDDVWVLRPQEAPEPLFDDTGDCWYHRRICGTFHERVGWHPCQMPLAILKRIIATSSNPGDLVLDPFSGSGTTCLAAAMLGRKYLGIEISSNYVQQSTQRVAEELSRQQPEAA